MPGSKLPLSWANGFAPDVIAGNAGGPELAGDVAEARAEVEREAGRVAEDRAHLPAARSALVMPPLSRNRFRLAHREVHTRGPPRARVSHHPSQALIALLLEGRDVSRNSAPGEGVRLHVVGAARVIFPKV